MSMTMAVVFLLAVAFLIWLFALASVLERSDFDPVTKFMWVFVIVVTWIVGAFLYLVIAPKFQPASEDDGAGGSTPTDDASDATACVACGAIIPPDETVCPECGWSYADTKPQ